MVHPSIRVRIGLAFAVAVLAAAPLFALADEITGVSTSTTGIRVEMIGTPPVVASDSFTSGGARYFLLSLSHAVLLGSPFQRFALPGQAAAITAAQYKDHPYIVHILVNDRSGAAFRVVTTRQAGARYLVTVEFTRRTAP